MEKADQIKTANKFSVLISKAKRRLAGALLFQILYFYAQELQKNCCKSFIYDSFKTASKLWKEIFQDDESSCNILQMTMSNKINKLTSTMFGLVGLVATVISVQFEYLVVLSPVQYNTDLGKKKKVLLIVLICFYKIPFTIFWNCENLLTKIG